MASHYLIDTSALVAMRDRDDRHHSAARTVLRDRSARFHTTPEVVAETFTLMRFRLGFGDAIDTVRALWSSSAVTVHARDESSELRVWQLLQDLRGLPLSHTDGSLIALGERLGIRTAFSFDSDFALAGFDLVPRATTS